MLKFSKQFTLVSFAVRWGSMSLPVTQCLCQQQGNVKVYDSNSYQYSSHKNRSSVCAMERMIEPSLCGYFGCLSSKTEVYTSAILDMLAWK